MFPSAFRASALSCVVGLLVIGGAAAADDSSPDAAKIDLKIGDAAPAFQLTDDQGKAWKSADHFKKKLVVVYFYPGDFTPGCMAQANAYRDAMNSLVEKGVEVIGISGDSVKTHELFKKVQKLNFTLLADEDGAIAKKFGVPFGKGGKVKAIGADRKPIEADGKPIEFERAGTAGRWTFIVGTDGKVVYKNTQVLPADDAKKILDFVKKSEEK
jgi:thioredoxin-dependent peroxiredoxin